MITVYSKPNCPHCEQAKGYLTRNSIQFEVVDITQDATARDFVVSKGHKTVPQLYVGPFLLVEGGNSELQKLSADTIQRRVAELRP